MGRLGAFRGCDDLTLVFGGDGSVRNDRMSPVGVQIEIGGNSRLRKTIIQHLLLSIVLSLDAESGSTLFSIILFAFSLRNECDVIGNELL